MVLLTQWTWVWVNSGSWWWTGRPGMLWSMGSQGVGHDWATELNSSMVPNYREVRLASPLWWCEQQPERLQAWNAAKGTLESSIQPLHLAHRRPREFCDLSLVVSEWLLQWSEPGDLVKGKKMHLSPKDAQLRVGESAGLQSRFVEG